VIVVDASVVTRMVVDDDDQGKRLRAELVGERLYAPELIDVEVASSIRRVCRHGQVEVERAVEALADLSLMRLVRISHTMLLNRMWELRDNLSAYDASYVALAQALDAPLWTADAPLARAPRLGCKVVLVA
jgi:predicted nucleic acid-binding protein